MFMLLVAFMTTGISLHAQYVVEDLTPAAVIREGLSLAQADDGRIFIAERAGIVKVYQNGTVANVFTVSTTTDSEQGLLGLTLHPNFASNGYIYVFYTRADKFNHIIERVQVNNSNQEVARQQILALDPIEGGFHNGGDLKFFNGYLFITTGDSQNNANSQNLDNYRGKILRVTADGQPAPGNPFFGTGSIQRQSIWAYGFRNPFRLVPNAKANKLFVLDVGTSWEEINDVTNPAPLYNYAWGHPQGGDGNQTETNLFVNPIFLFQTGSIGNALTNGVLYNPDVSRYPGELFNKFIIKDFVRNDIRYFDWTQNNPPSTVFYTSPHNQALGMILGNDGYIYYCQYSNTGNLIRLKYQQGDAPSVINHPASQSIVEGSPVTFAVDVSGQEPISYQWQYNNANITGATARTYTIAAVTLQNAGNYRCVISNNVGNVTSNNATLTVTAFNNRPTVQIAAPLNTLKWNADDNIYFEATATDVEDGVLPASAFSWSIDLFHEDVPGAGHSHPGASPQGVKSGTFKAGSQGEKTPNIWYRFTVTVTDSNGLTGTTYVDVHPNLITAVATTVPAGLNIELNLKPGVAPQTQRLVVNANLQALNAPTPQFIGNTRYDFDHWGHGGAANQAFTAPGQDVTYTAHYTATDVTQRPYQNVVAQIPGKIEAEHYDEGIDAYYDINLGGDGGFRAGDGVGSEGCSEGGYNIAWVVYGEWLEYTSYVAHTGNYTIGFRTATPYATRKLHLEVDGVNVTGTVNLPNTGGFQAWQTASVSNIRLTAGDHIIRLHFEANDINLNYINFTFDGDAGTPPVADFEVSPQTACFGSPVTFTSVSLGQIDSYAWNFGAGATPATATGVGPHTVTYAAASGTGPRTVTLTVNNAAGSNNKTGTLQIEDCTSTQHPYGGSPAIIPGRVEAEAYDTDGEGIAYHDLSAGNAGNEFRTDNVDIQGAAGSNYNVGWTEAGEWLEYTVNVTVHAEYNIIFTIATPYDNKVIHLEQNGVDITGPIAIPNTGGFQNWQTVTVSHIHLHEGISELRVHFEANDINFDFIDFEPMTGDDHEPQQPQENVTLQAEDAVVSGAVVTNNQGGYNGTGFVDYVNASGDYIEWTVNAAAGGPVTLYFDYALLGGNRPLEVLVNNASLGTYDFRATGSWAVWTGVPVTATLNTGTNKVKLLAKGSSGPNVDQLRVEHPTTADIIMPTAKTAGNETTIVAYPNPSSGHYTLSGTAAWTVKNSFGETVASGNGHEIDISGKPVGVYIITLNRGQKIKIIKR
jgi:glucose/arabinose dehydrogenase/PKD repeat protein